MTAIYQSPFLLALGWTIASSLWQTALLWMIYHALTNTSGKMSPATRHNLAFASILFAFAWFGITLSFKYNEFRQLLSATAPIQPVTGVTLAESGDVDGFILTAFLNKYLPYISASYLLVLALLAVRLVKAYFYVQQVKTKGLIEIDEHWSSKVERYSGYLRIHKKIRIYLSSVIDVPATLNFFKPVILLPVAAFAQLTPQQVESVILHELAHIKRNDYLINIVVSVIETILFFNPFVHLLGKSLKKEREHCCDDFVLHFRFDPHSYASALLSLEKLRITATPVGAIAATGNSKQLLGRVKRIMNVKSAGFNYGQKLMALLITACILISVAWLSPAPGKKNVSEEKETKQSTKEYTAQTENTVTNHNKAILNVLVKQPSGKQRMAMRKPDRTALSVPQDDISDVKEELMESDIDALPELPVPPPSPESPQPTPGFELRSFAPFTLTAEETMAEEKKLRRGNIELSRKQQQRSKTIPDQLLITSNDKLLRDLKTKDEFSKIITLLDKEGFKLEGQQAHWQDLRQLFDDNFFKNIDFNVSSNDNIDIDLRFKKIERKNKERESDERIKQEKHMDFFEWCEEENKEVFFHSKVQLDSIRQQSIRISEKQKQLWKKKNEAARQVQNALQQTYFRIVAERNRNEKNKNLARRQQEHEENVAAVVSSGNPDHAKEYANAATAYTIHNRAQAKGPKVANVSAAVQQISRVVIDTGRGNKTVVINIE